MKSSWSSFFPCSNCHSQNVSGARYCGSCGMNLYYNCPDCQGWVDVTFSNCPNCRVKLDWPDGIASPDRASSPAVMLLLLGIVMLVTGSVYLIVNNSGSANAVSNKSAGAAASTPASNTLPAINTLQSLLSNQNDSTSTGNADPADYPWYDSSSTPSQDDTSYEMVLTIPAAAPQVTDTAVNTAPSRSYLDTIYPTWGHCSGGRCRSITQ
jgi:hypothetical protein